MGWRTLFDEKTRQSAALFWFGLRDVGILQIYYSRVIIQRTIEDSPAFLVTGLAEKIAVCAHTTHDPICLKEGGLEVFLYEAAQNFEICSIIQGLSNGTTLRLI